MTNDQINCIDREVSRWPNLNLRWIYVGCLGLIRVIGIKGIVHYFTMSILKECAVNGHHNGGILSF